MSVLSLLAGAGLMALVPQVQDLFLERLTFGGALTYALVVLLFWAIPVHRAARRAVTALEVNGARLGDAHSGLTEAIDRWLPRALGAMTFLIVGTGLGRASAGLEGIGALAEAAEGAKRVSLLGWVVLAAAVGYAGYILMRHKVIGGARQLPQRAREITDPLHSWMPRVYAATTVVMFLWALGWPLEFTELFGRAALLPILLGGWLPLLNPLAIASHRWRWPVIATAIAAVLLLTTLAERAHDVRLFQSRDWEAAQLGGDKVREAALARQLLLPEAIEAWMKANDCSGEDCPRILLLAAEGGASRATPRAWPCRASIGGARRIGSTPSS